MDERGYMVGIEYGRITEKKADTQPARKLYKVESATRGGIQTRWIESVNAKINEVQGDPPQEVKAEYAVGDLVYYFMFPDGRGMVLGRVRTDI